ncbi:PilZ domain-containing protein [Rhabdothermincola salaria]|uniref:PilZ domain-containing protein n=1 Tax=Rhabdothermincola salaria TaxID=2903142 RepID=UPI001E52168D|nr:PilZ domain-containing protein [Rhabdothermincola salaria]MCD9622934.1 PilZ domain-containing protein [Rhabdothermincola salaria]
MTVAFEADVGSFERRIGRRIDVRPEIPVAVGGPDGASPPERATMVDVSVTGAGLEGPESLSMSPGTAARLDIEGRVSAVRVARATATDQPGVIHYGVEFTTLHPDVRELVNDLVGEGRPGENAWYNAI